jgi:tetratricopeptide (TPR) repeat protein
MYYGNYLSAIENLDEALTAFKRSAQLDPLSLIANAAVGWAYYHLRDFDAAVKQLRHALAMDAGFVVARLWLGRTLSVMGQWDEAIFELAEGVRLSSSAPGVMAELAAVYALKGNTQKTEELLAALNGISLARYVSPFDLALVSVALGDHDTAFAQLDKAVEERSPDLVMSRVDPRLDDLRDDSRFHNLLKRVGLPQ